MFSVGILLLQMAFPSLRSDNNLVRCSPVLCAHTLHMITGSSSCPWKAGICAEATFD